MKISLLITSRKNSIGLIDTINSYIDNCSSNAKIEVLVSLDNDDSTRFLVIDYFKNNHLVNIFELGRVGYFRLNESINFLCSKSSGNILLMTTDKCVMKSKNWDICLDPYENKFITGGAWTDWIEEDKPTIRRGGMILPMVHRKWYEVLNKIGNDVHMDSGVSHTTDLIYSFGKEGEEMCKKICKFFDNIVVEMDRTKGPQGKDIDKPGYSDFFSKESHNFRVEDAKRIFEFLKNNPQYIPES